MSGGAWCSMRHNRAGIVSNRNLWDKADRDRPGALSSVAVCGREACIAKATKYVAGETNETASLYLDADRAKP